MPMNTAVVHGPDDPAPLDVQVFREVLASFPAGVVVVTAVDGEQRPAGLTVSAFCSVSATPTLVLVCIDRGSKTLAAIQQSGAFTVNILAKGRQELAMLFASKRDNKFDTVASRAPMLPQGGPVLHEDAAAYVICKVERAIEAGDHWVFIGEAVEAGIEPQHPPLLYHRRGFVSLAS